MSDLDRIVRELVIANRILANEDGEVKPLSRGEIDARNAGYKPHSPETQRAWEYWARRAGCGDLLG